MSKSRRDIDAVVWAAVDALAAPDVHAATEKEKLVRGLTELGFSRKYLISFATSSARRVASCS